MKKALQFADSGNPMTRIRTLLVGMMLVLFASTTVAQNTVWDIIANSSDHSSLKAALVAAELDDDLSGEGPFTVFAPTNDAFNALPAGMLDALLANPTGALAEILLYHVVGAKVMSADLSDGQMITTLNGDSVTVKITDGNVYIDDAMVTVADTETDNGVVHVINAVLLPTASVVDVIAASPVHTTLEAALIAAELVDDLSGEGPFTVFAPTDDAFAALPAGMLDALLANPTGALAEILLYHVAGTKALSTDLSDGQMITTLNGDSVTVKIADGSVYIDDAMVTVADIEADNGVIHVIDAVLLPTSNVVDVITASPAHTTLEAALIAAELVDDLSGEGPFTVFAPTDDAFAALPEGMLDGLLANPTGDLAKILLYHVASGKTMSADLSDGQTITTLHGGDLTVKIADSSLYINESMVIFTDIETDNGVIHVIDAVLLPKTGVHKKSIDKAAVSVYPNPASECINVRFEALEESEIDLVLYDILGKQVRVKALGRVSGGEHVAEMHIADVDPGMYFLVINAGNDPIANKIRIVK